jgi:hypothetical protein
MSNGDEKLAPRNVPSVAQILEFAKRSKAINVEVTIGTLMEHLSLVEPKGGAVADAGWGIVNPGYAIVTSGDLASEVERTGPVARG